MKSEEEKDEQLIRWLEGELSGQELSAFEASEEFEDYEKIARGAEAISYPIMDQEEVFSKIQQRTSKSNEKTAKHGSKLIKMRRWLVGVAAIAIVAFAVTTLIPKNINVTSDVGQYVSHTLPDGSVVEINGNSHIDYKDNFRNKRHVHLGGEAFFKVKKGETFTVHTTKGLITVLGTSFNIFARDQFLIVSCKTGKVKVDANDQSFLLEKGDRVFIDQDGTSGKDAIDIDKIGSWVDGVSHFSDATLDEVVLSMTSIYDIEIALPAKHKNRRFRGSFVHNDIKKALKMVFSPMEIPYSLDDQKKVVFND